MSQQRAHLEVVELDSRIVPSATKGQGVVQAPPAAADLKGKLGKPPGIGQSSAAQSPLSGTGSGVVYLSPAHVVGGGHQYILVGTASLGMGQVSVVGGITYFANGTASGKLKLSNGSGTVILRITAANQSGHYNYQVTGSTIAGIGGHGTLVLSITGSSFSLTL
jgi:hypothetical protein